MEGEQPDNLIDNVDFSAGKNDDADSTGKEGQVVTQTFAKPAEKDRSPFGLAKFGRGRTKPTLVPKPDKE